MKDINLLIYKNSEKLIMLCFVFSLLICVSFFLSGCSDNVVEDPPDSRSELFVDLFRNLQGKKYNEASGQIKRLRELDRSNMFLIELQNMIETNKKICRLNKLLNKEGLKSAMQTASEERKESGVHLSRFNKEYDLLEALSRLKINIGILNNPEAGENKIQRAYKSTAKIAEIHPELKELAEEILQKLRLSRNFYIRLRFCKQLEIFSSFIDAEQRNDQSRIENLNAIIDTIKSENTLNMQNKMNIFKYDLSY